MAISNRAIGSWAEYTTDLQTVTIPGSPAAGDRMFLWVQWKDFAITLATPNGWNLIQSFADGSVSTGNGLGSITTAVYYRDWQSGDAAPTLDFSTTTNLLAEAVILIFAKGASEVWKTPDPKTAAWPATSTTQTVSASAAGLVPDNSVVMAGIGLRDDSATFTRAATTGIDVSSGITWSADYVEAPATHYSTTTGNDHSGDLGYRFITTGGSGTSTVTLRVTATISATETGSVVWVVQGVDSPVTATPGVLSLATSVFAPTVTATNNKLVTPGVLSLTTSTFAPTVSAPRLVTPPTLSLVTSAFAPTVSAPRLATPSTAGLSLTTFAPDVTIEEHGVTVIPGTATLSTSAFAPTVAAPRLVMPDEISLTTSTFAPTIQTPRLATPATADLALTEQAPTINIGVRATPTTHDLSLATFAATVTASDHQRVVPGVKALATTRFTPDVEATADWVFTPGTRMLTLTAFRPYVGQHETQMLVVGGLEPPERLPFPQQVTPRTRRMALLTVAPDVRVIDDASVLALFMESP